MYVRAHVSCVSGQPVGRRTCAVLRRYLGKSQVVTYVRHNVLVQYIVEGKDGDEEEEEEVEQEQDEEGEEDEEKEENARRFKS